LLAQKVPFPLKITDKSQILDPEQISKSSGLSLKSREFGNSAQNTPKLGIFNPVFNLILEPLKLSEGKVKAAEDKHLNISSRPYIPKGYEQHKKWYDINDMYS
jgi:hypothetical protein